MHGLLAVYTGNGKGKTTSSLGHIVRALGHGKKVAVVQFIKGSWQTGEQKFFQEQNDVDFHVMGRGFTWNSEDLDKDIAIARDAWHLAVDIINENNYDLVVLDELTYLPHYNMIEESVIVDVLLNKPKNQHIIVTGRYASNKLIEIADLVTEMQEVKHPFKKGIKAQAGFDF
ncbi:MAG: cob(I)yrinic acid a,c-diamide adenosyltransferase [Desulfotalea sp.]